MIAISVVVPVRNAGATLGRALAALAAQQLEQPFEVIVVDDGSTDGSLEHAQGAGPPVVVLEQAAIGPAQARNLGAAHARGGVLAFCDADCFADPGWLAAGLAALEGADLVQGSVQPATDVERGPFDRTLSVGAEVGLYETANLFVTRAVFDQVGGFEDWLAPRFGKAMAEDVWLGWRIRRLGVRTAFCAEARVRHAVFPRGPAGYVAERRRLEHFPAMVRKIPELRDTLCWRRPFLSPRTAAFDAATAGLVVALARRSPLPLAAAVPYAGLAWRRARPYGRRLPAVVAADIVADAVGLAALAWGSASARSLLI